MLLTNDILVLISVMQDAAEKFPYLEFSVENQPRKLPRL